MVLVKFLEYMQAFESRPRRSITSAFSSNSQKYLEKRRIFGMEFTVSLVAVPFLQLEIKGLVQRLGKSKFSFYSYALHTEATQIIPWTLELGPWRVRKVLLLSKIDSIKIHTHTHIYIYIYRDDLSEFRFDFKYRYRDALLYTL